MSFSLARLRSPQIASKRRILKAKSLLNCAVNMPVAKPVACNDAENINQREELKNFIIHVDGHQGMTTMNGNVCPSPICYGMFAIN